MLTKFPSLDCHAHVSPKVTQAELSRLGDAIVFAVTRTLEEAESALRRQDENLIWGCGAHPGVRRAIASFDLQKFMGLVSRFALVGEIGLDRPSGQLDQQVNVLQSILRAARNEPVLLSLHSRGCARQLVEAVAANPHPGVILHWFISDRETLYRAIKLGCYFSVNVAVPDSVLGLIPIERLLPETDFPTSIRDSAPRRPGDLDSLERRVSRLTDMPLIDLRRLWYRNLRRLSVASGALDRFPEAVADLLIAA